MTQRNTKIKMIIIFSVSILGIGGMMNHAVKMHELEQQKGTREYYSGEKPATSFPLQNVFANLNPFQKNISKSVNVTTSISPWWYDFAAKSCFKTSISKAQLDNLLSNGVKVITMSHWEVVPYAWSDFTCIGYTYVLEGPENLLNKP